MLNFFKKKKLNKEFKNRTNLSSIKEIIPTSFLDVKDIAEILLKERKVCVFLSKLEQNERRRIIDFLSGIVFTYKGNIKTIKSKTYVFTI